MTTCMQLSFLRASFLLSLAPVILNAYLQVFHFHCSQFHEQCPSFIRLCWLGGGLVLAVLDAGGGSAPNSSWLVDEASKEQFVVAWSALAHYSWHELRLWHPGWMKWYLFLFPLVVNFDFSWCDFYAIFDILINYSVIWSRVFSPGWASSLPWRSRTTMALLFAVSVTYFHTVNDPLSVGRRFLDSSTRRKGRDVLRACRSEFASIPF